MWISVKVAAALCYNSFSSLNAPIIALISQTTGSILASLFQTIRDLSACVIKLELRNPYDTSRDLPRTTASLFLNIFIVFCVKSHIYEEKNGCLFR